MREPPAVTRLRRKYRVVAPELDERRRRQWAAAEAREIGYGGVSVVARATGLARSTIHAGLRDVRASRRQRVRAAERIRRAGGGPAAADDERSGLAHRAVGADRADDARRPGVAVALDL